MVIVMAMNIRFGEGVLRKREAMNGSFTSYIYIYIYMYGCRCRCRRRCMSWVKKINR